MLLMRSSQDSLNFLPPFEQPARTITTLRNVIKHNTLGNTEKIGWKCNFLELVQIVITYLPSIKEVFMELISNLASRKA